MAKFVYPMQNILELKQKLEDQEKINFGLAQAKVNEEQEKLRQIMIRQADYERQLKEASQGNINIVEIKTCKNAVNSMKVALRDQMIQLSKAQKQLEVVRKRLNTVMQERKMHEKLREHAFDEFKKELLHEEGKLTDELVSYTYFSKMNEEVY